MTAVKVNERKTRGKERNEIVNSSHPADEDNHPIVLISSPNQASSSASSASSSRTEETAGSVLVSKKSRRIKEASAVSSPNPHDSDEPVSRRSRKRQGPREKSLSPVKKKTKTPPASMNNNRNSRKRKASSVSSDGSDSESEEGGQSSSEDSDSVEEYDEEDDEVEDDGDDSDDDDESAASDSVDKDQAGSRKVPKYIHENRCYRCGQGKKKVIKCKWCTQAFHPECGNPKFPDICADCKKQRPKCTLCHSASRPKPTLEHTEEAEEKEDEEEKEEEGDSIKKSDEEKKCANIDACGVLFRCSRCDETFHFACLTRQLVVDPVRRSAKLKSISFFLHEYHCFNCLHWPNNVEEILDMKYCLPEEKDSVPKSDDASVSLKTSLPSKQMVFLVKFGNLSHRFDDWVPESWLKGVSKQKLKNYLHNLSPISPDATKVSLFGQNHHLSSYHAERNHVVNADWMIPDRILSVDDEDDDEDKSADDEEDIEDRSLQYFNLPEEIDGAHFKSQYLVKWKDSVYDESTWEYAPFPVGSNGTPDDAAFKESFNQALERYHRKCKINSQSSISEVSLLEKSGRFKKDRESFKTVAFEETPEFITDGKLMKHQIEGLK